MIRELETIDAHAAGQPVRLVVAGFPTPRGRRLRERQAWLRRHADHLRRALLLEPRGHTDLTGVLFTEPETPGADAGMLVMDAAGWPASSGPALVAAVTIGIERGLLPPALHDAGTRRVLLDLPNGPVALRARVEARAHGPRVDAVAFTTPPAFVCCAARTVRLGTRSLRVDVAFGGVAHAILDTEAIGVPLERDRLPDLRRLGAGIRQAVETAGGLVHPADGSPLSLAGVVFTGPPRDPEAHLRSAVVTGDGLLDRSPGGSETAAVMAVLDAMGLLPDDQVFVHEGLAGERFRGRVRHRQHLGDCPALVAEIEGTAWLTGTHRFWIDDDDPLREGLRL